VQFEGDFMTDFIRRERSGHGLRLSDVLRS